MLGVMLAILFVLGVVVPIIVFWVIPLVVPGRWSMFTTTSIFMEPYREKILKEYLKEIENREEI